MQSTYLEIKLSVNAHDWNTVYHLSQEECFRPHCVLESVTFADLVTSVAPSMVLCHRIMMTIYS